MHKLTVKISSFCDYNLTYSNRSSFGCGHRWISSGCERCTSTGSSVDSAGLAAEALHQADCTGRAEDYHRLYQVAVMLLVMNAAGRTVYITVLFDCYGFTIGIFFSGMANPMEKEGRPEWVLLSKMISSQS